MNPLGRDLPLDTVVAKPGVKRRAANFPLKGATALLKRLLEAGKGFRLMTGLRE
jgi:hypothetical protein